MILSRSQQAFDLKYEDPRVVDRYGKGLGEQMLQARRLCEAGCGFVTLQHGGWDMHSNIKQEMDRRGPEIDPAFLLWSRTSISEECWRMSCWSSAENSAVPQKSMALQDETIGLH